MNLIKERKELSEDAAAAPDHHWLMLGLPIRVYELVVKAVSGCHWHGAGTWLLAGTPMVTPLFVSLLHWLTP